MANTKFVDHPKVVLAGLVMPFQQPYRPLPDQRIRAAEFRLYRLLGKGLLLLLSSISTPMIFGFKQAHHFDFWWLFAIPVMLAIALCWGSFPAFCRCPGCKRRMRPQNVEGRVNKAHAHFNELGPTKHFLVCDKCRLCVFWGKRISGIRGSAADVQRASNRG